MKRGTIWLVSVSLLVCAGALTAHTGPATDLQGTLAHGWQRHPIAGKGAGVSFDGVYAGTSGFLALGQGRGWVSSDGQVWKPAPANLARYALRRRFRDLNLRRVALTLAVNGIRLFYLEAG